MTDRSAITITPTAAGAVVVFPKDRALIDEFRASFPTARFSGISKTWSVTGKTAVKRLEAWKAVASTASGRSAALKAEDAQAQAAATIEATKPRLAPHKIVAVLAGSTVRLAFPRAEAANAVVRSAGYKWDKFGGAWEAPLSRVGDYLPAQLAAVAAVFEEDQAEGDKAEAAAREALAAHRDALSGAGVNYTISGETVIFDFPKGEATNALMRVMGGRYYARGWCVPLRNAGDAERWPTRPGKILAARECDREAERAGDVARQAEAGAEGAAGRGVEPWAQRTAPAVGESFRLVRGGPLVTVERLGRRYLVDLDAFSLRGSRGMGLEEVWAVDVHYRPATEAEVAALEEREAKARIRREAIEALRELDRRLQAPGALPPQEELDLQAERLYRLEPQFRQDPQLRAYGGGRSYVVEGGWLWRIDQHSGDGDAWGAYNGRGLNCAFQRIAYDEEVQALFGRVVGVLGSEWTAYPAF